MATRFKGQGRLTNQRVSLPAARAQGKSDWAINEKLSQVLWVEGRTSFICTQTITDTLFSFILDILTAFFEHKEGLYKDKVGAALWPSFFFEALV